MKQLTYLFDHGYIRFRDLLSKTYLQLRLSETEYVILIKLYELEQKGMHQLDTQSIATETTLSPDDLANTIDLLMQKGLVSLDVSETNGLMEEVFSTFPTLMRVLDLKEEPKVNQTKEIATLVEREFKRPLSSKELQMISVWEYTLEAVKEALVLMIQQDKISIDYLNKILENKAKETVKDMSYFDQFLND